MRSLRRRLALALVAGFALTLVLAAGALGLDWTSPQRVTDTRPSQLTALHELAGSDGALHLVHGRLGPRPVDDRLLYQRSSRGGATWSEETILFASSAANRFLVPNFAIVADGDLVVVAFRTRGDGTSLWSRRSEDGGKHWRPKQLLDDTRLQRGIGVPALSISGETVVAAWTNRSNGRILLRRSTDGARTWSPARVMGSSDLSIECEDTLLDGLVGLAASGRVVHLAWSDGKDGACLSNALRLRTSRDGGRTWSAQRTASTGRTFGWPELTARGAHLLMTLQEPDGGFILVRSKDGGRTFTERAFAATGDRALGAADVLLPGGDVAWLVYADLGYDRDAVEDSRIRFRISDDRGKTWGPGTTVVGTTDKLRQAANLAANGARPVVVFQSGRLDGSTADIVVVRAK